MASTSKQPKLDKRESFQTVRRAFEAVKVLDIYPQFNFEQLQCTLSMKYGYDVVAKLTKLISEVCILIFV